MTFKPHEVPMRSTWNRLSRLSIVMLITPPLLAEDVSGSIAANSTWRAAASPYVLKGTVNIEPGVTLTIEPGTTVHLERAVDLIVKDGGRLLAEGSVAAPIRFTRPPNTRLRWGGIVVGGSAGSPETRIAHAHIQGNDFSAIYSAHGTVLLDDIKFETRDRQYLSLDGSSFVVSRCHFPTTTNEFEPLHGSGGIKPGGHGIFRECFFGGSDGYSDIVDFTGSNREKNQPIVQFYDNVFVGSSDDAIDLDGTDGWIEGNIFLHVHRNGAPDTASAVSGGSKRRDKSQVTIIGNLFFDCDHAVTSKEGNFFTLINNTIVHMTKTGGMDSGDGVACVRDLEPSPTTFGEGIYLEGNIVLDARQLVRNYDGKETRVTFCNNILPLAWDGPGSGNVVADPGLKHVPQLAETQFKTWEEAQVLRDWFSLLPGSPAIGSGPNGRDQGGVIPLGVSVSGEPRSTTDRTTADLVVGVKRTGNGIPSLGWPQGAGYTHYKWRLDGGTWSAETPVETPLAIADLAEGPHYVEVVGKRDCGIYQDDAALGPDSVITRSRTWTVEARK